MPVPDAGSLELDFEPGEPVEAAIVASVNPQCDQPVFEWITARVDRFGFPVLRPLDSTSGRAESRSGANSKEAVPGPLLASLYGFQQESRPTVVDLSEQGQWGLEICEDLAHDGNMISLLGERLELLWRCAEHESSRSLSRENARDQVGGVRKTLLL